MSTVPATPRHRHTGSTATAGPSTPVARLANSTSTVHQASPHYATTRRHSLYGTEDRVVIDPGSRIWKAGFSGEGRPRDVFCATDGGALWALDRAADIAEREEEARLLEAKLQQRFRALFHDSLMTDPKSRKVILVEHPLLPLYIKEAIARVLFRNLQVPSISFAPSPLLALLTAGRITGLVLDCGHLESTSLPIFAARPLFPQLRTTPLAGERLTAHLRALLTLFGTYLPPLTTLSAAANIPQSTRSMRVPEEVLSDAVIEEIKTRCCLVGHALEPAGPDTDSSRMMTPDPDFDFSDATRSESEFSRVSMDVDSGSSQSYAAVPRGRPRPAENALQALASMYTRHSTATDMRVPVVPPVAQQTGTGRGTLIVPGWVRERAAEVLFEGGDVDESSVAEVVLDSLLKVPMDLRKTMAGSILVVGGTAMLPGFIPRLHAELIRTVTPAPPAGHRARPDRPPVPRYDRYAPLRALLPHFAILNNPAPEAGTSAGKAPAFAPATMAWVGGSLAGALKTGGMEVARERWDEVDAAMDPDADAGADAAAARSAIPDWTRGLLPLGAPPAVGGGVPPGIAVVAPSPARTAVVGA